MAVEADHDWDVRVEDSTVVVELPTGLELDRETGERINAEFFDAVARPDTDSVLTLLAVENPLGTGLFDEVQRGAEEAARSGVTDWAIVVQEQVKGMAFQSSIDDLSTDVFEDERDARQFLA